MCIRDRSAPVQTPVQPQTTEQAAPTENDTPKPITCPVCDSVNAPNTHFLSLIHIFFGVSVTIAVNIHPT